MDAAFKLGTPKLCDNPACSSWFTPTAKMQERTRYCPDCRKKGIYQKMRPKRVNGRQHMRENGIAVPGRKQAGRR